MAFRWKLALSFTLLAAAVLLLLGAYLHSAVARHTSESIRERLLAETRQAARVLPALPWRPGPELQRLVRELDQRSSARVTLIDHTGTVLADSRHDPATMGNHADRPERLEALVEGWGSATRHSRTLGVDMLYVAVPLSERLSEATVLRLAVPLTAVQAQSEELRRALVVAFLISVALVSALSIWLAGTLTRPIQRLADAARRVDQGDLQARVREVPSGELAEVAELFNRAVARLAELVTSSQREGRYYATILQQMTDGVVVVDGKGRVEFVNAAFARMFGVEGEAARGRYLDQVVRVYELGDLLRRAAEQGAAQQDELELLHPESRTLVAVATPLPGPEEEVVGAVGLVHDVTELRHTDQVRQDFVANASHELRTPAAAIKALAEALQAGALHEEQRAGDFVGQIVEAADRLTELLDDMLTLTRVERGQELLNRQWLSASEALAEAARRAEPAAHARGVALHAQVADSDQVYADPDALQTVLMNLLGNAIKYTPAEGEVALSGKAAPGGYEVSVTDTGIGIPEEHIPRIFERFYRVDKARDRAAGGTGLGLAIIRHIAEAHGGKVSVRSSPGEGSTFTVFFPDAQ